MGYGHYEPLRHYAEVHLLLEPLPAGSGLEFGTVCSTDDLALNWQRLVLTNAMERQHKGVLTGAPIDDMRITLVSARTHLKHTEGGDIRQATYRAIRQALMRAKERGETRVIEPWYRFSLEIPQENVGRALADLTRMTARVEPPMMHGSTAVLEGSVPAGGVRGLRALPLRADRRRARRIHARDRPPPHARLDLLQPWGGVHREVGSRGGVDAHRGRSFAQAPLARCRRGLFLALIRSANPMY